MALTPLGTAVCTAHATGQFNSPWGITQDQQGDVYVADHKNHRVQKFTPDGEFIMQFGRGYGTGKGQLNRPSGVAVDPEGDVHVCDRVNHRVQVFGPDGQVVISLYGAAQELSKWAKMTLAASPDTMKASTFLVGWVAGRGSHANYWQTRGPLRHPGGVHPSSHCPTGTPVGRARPLRHHPTWASPQCPTA